MIRLLAIVGVLLVVGFFVALRAPVPSISAGNAVPVPADELWTLNPN